MAMGIQFPLSILFTILLLLVFTTAEDNDGVQPFFSYAGKTGPENWGSLSPLYVACSNGKTQSPIDIKKDHIVDNKSLLPLERNYTDVNATLINNGHNIEVEFEENIGGFNLNGKYYPLKQIHWHTPAEHRIEGKQPAAELHLVHHAEDGTTSVVAVLYKLGSADPIIKKIEGQLRQLANKDSPIALGTFNVRHLRRKARKYYRYVGSLTTPPCTENVIWNVLGRVRTISKQQVELLKASLEADFKNNARPAQPLNGRKVEVYSHSHKKRS